MNTDLGALAVMTFISVALGQIFNAVPSGLSNGLPLDDIAASIAFAYFGFRTLIEALQLEDDVKAGSYWMLKRPLRRLTLPMLKISGISSLRLLDLSLRQNLAIVVS